MRPARTPITDKSNVTDRDGPVMPDDPSLTRMQNCVNYMRRHPMYMPPNEWPSGMLITVFSERDEWALHPIALSYCTLDEFETITEKAMFDRIGDDEAKVLVYAPVLEKPKEMAAYTDAFFQNPNFQPSIQYLITNRWYLRRDEVK